MNGSVHLINTETKEVIENLGNYTYDSASRLFQMLEVKYFDKIYALEIEGICTDMVIVD